ncbi:MAG: efflux RND transporter periplasmic adaptor subunit [Candidatus Aminicenantaceae bacterium]
MKQKQKFLILISIISIIVIIILFLLIVKPGSGKFGESRSSLERPFKVFRMDLHDKLTEVGEVSPVEVYSLRFPLSEKITRVFVSEDDPVNEGDMLLCIDNTQILSQKKSFEARILKTEYDLRTSSVMDSKRKLEIEEKILETENSVSVSKRKLEAAREMFSEELISKEKLDFIENQTKALENTLKVLNEEEKNLEYERLKTEALSKTLESLKFQLKQVDKVLEKCCLESPVDGKVIWMERVKVGGFAPKNEVVIRIADMDKVEIKTYLFESDIWRIEEGAEIYVRSGEKRIQASLKRISQVAEKSASGNKFPCYLQASNIEERFRVGSNVEVVFLVDKRPDVLVVPLKYLIQKEGKSTVLKKTDDHIEEVPVETGFDDTKYIEIRKGLKEGDTIIYPYERF